MSLHTYALCLYRSPVSIFFSIFVLITPYKGGITLPKSFGITKIQDPLCIRLHIVDFVRMQHST